MVRKSKYQFIEPISGSNFQKCKHKESGHLVAIKQYKGTSHMGMGKQVLRNLKRCQHPNVLKLREVSKRKQRISLIFEYLPYRLLDVIQRHPQGMPEEQIRSYIHQCLMAVKHCHSVEIFHRDIKPEKIMLDQSQQVVKLAGFGLARRVDLQKHDHTKHVTTSWYRSPEVILESKYGTGIDIWAIGCVMAELIDSQPLFPGESEIDVLYLIEHIVGPLSEEQKKICRRHPKFNSILRSKKYFHSLESRYHDKMSPAGLNLLKQMLNVDPNERLTAAEALAHPWFKNHKPSEPMRNKQKPPQPHKSHKSHTMKKQGEKPVRRRYPVKVTSSYDIQIGSTSSHVTVSFHRVLRASTKEKKDKLISLGKFPIHRVDDYIDSVPESWKRHGGIFIGMKQSDAMQLCLEFNSRTPKGLQVGYGSVNVFSGNGWNRESKDMKDYKFLNSHTTVNGVFDDTTGDTHQFISPALGQDEANILQIVLYGTISSSKSNLPSLSFPNIGRKENMIPLKKNMKKRSKYHKYEILNIVAEGTYGVVMKAQNRETGQICAIKRFKDYDHDDEAVRKIILREKKILKLLTQQNIICLQESFRKNGKMHLVFEYVPKSLLDVLQENENGLEQDTIRIIMYQLLKALEYCHSQDIIHRDVKLENVLLYEDKSLKLCDFGFARIVSKNNTQTDYVSTRWYRSPELLVSCEYGKPVDVWAAGCIMGELLDGQPLFAGNTDLDQLYVIKKVCGEMPSKQIDAFHKKYTNYKLPKSNQNVASLRDRFYRKVGETGMEFMECMLKLDPDDRLTCTELLSHPYFDSLDVENIVLNEQSKINQEVQKQEESENPSLPLLLTSWHQGNPKPNNTSYRDDLSMKPPKPKVSSLFIPSQSQKKQRTGKKTPRESILFTKRKHHRRDSLSPMKNGQQTKRRQSLVTPEQGSRTSSRQSSRQSSRKGKRKLSKKKTTPQLHPEPVPSIQLDHHKFGRFYVHILNSESYRLLTGFEVGNTNARQEYQKYQMEWKDEYDEKTQKQYGYGMENIF